ncbi:MAG: thiol-disulfide oxidoreductase DCC family protein [Bacteroidia bacterium]|nr:thiol-disulfide oxidoreductase DCC family protein [Bacteroidia bacterium]
MNPIIIFDGVCHLCNQSVDFVINRDKKGEFRYTANQMQAGRDILLEHGKDPEAVVSVYLLEDGVLYEKSAAALRIARKLGFPWSLAYAFVIVPTPLRNLVYDWIARNRYKWFGKKESCRLPTPQERALFLD